MNASAVPPAANPITTVGLENHPIEELTATIRFHHLDLDCQANSPRPDPQPLFQSISLDNVLNFYLMSLHNYMPN